MSFDEQVKMLANEIYIKVIKYINKNYDYKNKILYKKMYYKTDGNRKVEFDSNVFIYDDIYRLSIHEDHLLLIKNSFIYYETNLDKLIEECESGILKNACIQRLEKQNHFTDIMKEDLINYLNMVSEDIDSLSFDRKRMEYVDNLNDESHITYYHLLNKDEDDEFKKILK